MRKYGQEGFFHLIYVEPKHQSDEHNQSGANDFQHLIWIFWVCWLSPVWYNVDCSPCLNLIAINFNWSTRPWSIVQWEISSTKLRKALLIHLISRSTFSKHCTNLFLHFSCVFTFLEIIKHNMPKMLLFSSIFNIKISTQKCTNFDDFLMHTNMTAVTIQCNKIISNEVKDN